MANQFPAPTQLQPPPPPPPPADEAAWLAKRDLAQEATFTHVAGPLLTPGSLVMDERGQPSSRLGRNLLVESEHAANERSARELLRKRTAAEDPAQTADEIASRGPSDGAVTYMRENADRLTDELATKQAKAAQTLIDSYGELATLRQRPQDVAELIPENELGQARWITRAKADVATSLDGVPVDIAAPIQERLAKLGAGHKPERWFTTATSLSDELLRASARASRAGDTETVERLAMAKSAVDRGLTDPGLWGDAAKNEAQRSEGYARRFGEHIDGFEALFTTPGARGERVVTADKFRELLGGADDPNARSALQAAIDGAKATADVARKFGRTDKAAEIERSIAILQRAEKQGAAVRTARGVAHETLDPSAAALEWLSRATTPGEAGLSGPAAQRQLEESALFGLDNPAAQAAAVTLEARGGAFRAVNALTRRSEEEVANGIGALFSPPQLELDDEEIAAAAAPSDRVTLLNYDATRSHIDKMARDPAYFGAVMASSFGNMAESAPELYDGLAQQTAKVVQYLSAVAPGGETGGPFAQRYAVGEDELWEYNQRFNAVTDPSFIPQQIAMGRATSQSIAAYEVMNPGQYGQLRITMFERLEDMKRRGVQVPIQTREQIDVLLNIDGGGDPALTWKVAERGYAAIARKNASRSKRPDGGIEGETGMTSGALATLNNGASAIAQTG
jgi:hypothetical protein